MGCRISTIELDDYTYIFINAKPIGKHNLATLLSPELLELK